MTGTQIDLLKWDSQSAVLLGLASFQLADAWTKNAPSLSEMRAATPGDITIKQRLLDADMTVGTLALVIGLVVSALTHDISALIVMLGVFLALAAWSHAILAAESR